MIQQHSIRNSISASGVGLHTGKPLTVNLYPAEPNTGLILRRTDGKAPVDIPLKADLVTDTRLSTAVAVDGVEVSTVEHLMSALWGMGIDNAIIEIDGPEIPIMDGSASPFVFLIQSAGLAEQNAPRQYMRVLKPIEVRNDPDGSWVRLEPYDGFKLSFTLVYNHPVMAEHGKEFTVDLTEQCYIREISRARTFGFMQDIENMQASNKALGASLVNAVALDDSRVLNQGGLRQQNEFARHKVLDAIGDLYLTGHPLLAHFTGYKSGHRLNNALVRKLLATSDSWELTTCEQLETDSPVPGWDQPQRKLRASSIG